MKKDIANCFSPVIYIFQGVGEVAAVGPGASVTVGQPVTYSMHGAFSEYKVKWLFFMPVYHSDNIIVCDKNILTNYGRPEGILAEIFFLFTQFFTSSNQFFSTLNFDWSE